MLGTILLMHLKMLYAFIRRKPVRDTIKGEFKYVNIKLKKNQTLQYSIISV
jgi:hypothetical protein